MNAFKNSISRRMNACDKILVLVGKETYKSDWCKWEIKKAEELELDFAAVNIEHANASPISLYGKGVKGREVLLKQPLKAS
ncbi:TIR domain-containing protein (plasmid) [Planococcus glaciei]|nr:TIR domain-containing protein [Planococcus glaciei]QDY46929.1 TIR domain-containing protein [Planococcus glaciei]